MPLSNYLKIVVGDYEAQVSDPETIPVSIDWSLENPENFQEKTSGSAIDIEIPATLLNSRIANSYHLPDVMDLTIGEVFKGNQFGMIEANGWELLIGRAFLKSAKHNGSPLSYTYNFLGDNADWVVDLKEKTLYDYVKDINFVFDKATMEASWLFDGSDPDTQTYVFAPARYRSPFAGYFIDDNGILQPDDSNFLPVYARPALFKYPIIYKAFKSIGYRIQSDFLDSEYFRRQVMPWTWGSFLSSEGTQLETHGFLAKSEDFVYFTAEKGSGGKIDNEIVDLGVTNDNHDGGFDNNVSATNLNGDYTYDAVSGEMRWKYNTPDFGLLDATFSMRVDYDYSLSGNNSDLNVYVEWLVNGELIETDTIVKDKSGTVGTHRLVGYEEVFFHTSDYPSLALQLNDEVEARVRLRLYRDKTYGVAHIALKVSQFQLDYFRVPLGGNIDFTNFTSAFQRRKVLDYIAGVFDEFNLAVKTDPVNKVVYIEPLHPYSIVNDLTVLNDGYFKEDFVDWNGKEDLSKVWEMENYADVEKELTFKYKDDSNDGILKKIQDRQQTKLANGKYVFPERFQTGSKDHENRFFSPTMHYEVTQWKTLGTGSNSGITPQMVCIVPENISQTSASESENTFEPKSCYYKGLVTGAGAWRWDGVDRQDYPFMFAVNYQTGGENDPILSYSDEFITGNIGKGLLKRFFWQRLAIDRNGQRYTSWFRLKNFDVANQLHREYKSYKGQRWECIQIKGYKPLMEESTQVLLYKWSPVSTYERDHTFPSATSVTTSVPTGDPDIKYYPLKCLTSDIPT